jgi:hypothetical protein
MKRTLSRLAMLTLTFSLAAAVSACKAKPGESCSNENEAKCMDPAGAILCHEKKWVRNDCRGPKGCKEVGTTVDCDESLAQEKEFCDHEGNIACSADKKTQLKCEKFAWKTESKCNGPKGCSVSGNLVDCDEK